MRRSVRKSIALIAATGLALGGCGSDDDGEASGPEETEVADAAADTTGGGQVDSAGDGGADVAIDACALVDDATVEQVLGEAAAATDGTTGDLYACSWEGVADPLNVLSVSVYAHPDAATAQEMYEETNEGLGGAEVPDVGDAASYSDAFGLDVLFDRYDIAVDNTGPDEQQSDIVVARAIIEQLDA
jgi:hypothetical protein